MVRRVIGKTVKRSYIISTVLMSLMSTRWRGICDQMQVLSRKRGHCDPRSAITYHITERVLGQQLQADMFGKNVADAVIGKGEK